MIRKSACGQIKLNMVPFAIYAFEKADPSLSCVRFVCVFYLFISKIVSSDL